LAAELAKAPGARLHILSVVATPVPDASPTAYEPGWTERAEQTCREDVDRALATVEELGVHASSDVVVGSPVDELVELSRRVEVLVVGSRRWGPVRRLLLGSTSDRLVREAACPLIAVPRPPATD
jgi:nucleotide-binding universal stress UspA family protein